MDRAKLNLSGHPELIPKINWKENIACKELLLSACELDEFPEELVNLTQLELIEAKNNQIKVVPDYFTTFRNLNFVSLGGNLFQSLPYSLLQLPELKVLLLQNCQILTMPDLIPACFNLMVLDLEGNQISSIPDYLFNSKLNLLWKINFSNNKLDSIPDGLQFLPSLRSAYLSKNNIKEIPHSIFQSKMLQNIFIGSNQITHIEIPSNLTVSSLKELDLSRNLIETLSGNWEELNQLQVLNLSGNKLKRLSHVKFPASLKKLIVYDNEISKQEIEKLKTVNPAMNVIDNQEIDDWSTEIDSVFGT